jgi:hypothetical protein
MKTLVGVVALILATGAAFAQQASTGTVTGSTTTVQGANQRVQAILPAQAPVATPSTRTPAQAIKEYKASGNANPGPKIKPAVVPPSPVVTKTK